VCAKARRPLRGEIIASNLGGLGLFCLPAKWCVKVRLPCSPLHSPVTSLHSTRAAGARIGVSERDDDEVDAAHGWAGRGGAFHGSAAGK
jgi:hypothetical protein